MNICSFKFRNFHPITTAIPIECSHFIFAFIYVIIIFVLGKESKSSGATKTSFLASLNPTRWGRSSSSVPDRPPPPKEPVISRSLPAPSLANHKEKIKQWIKDQGQYQL